MALNNLIHKYSDRQLEEMDQDMVYSINIEANKDFIKRTIPGSIIIFSLLIISGLISHVPADSPLLYYGVTSFSFVCIVAHLFLFRTIRYQSAETIKQWEAYFSIVVISTAVCWGIYSSWSLIQYGITEITLVCLLFSVGIGSGAAAAIFIWKRMAQFYLIIVLVPPIVILTSLHESNLAWGLSASFAIYFSFLFFQVIRSNNEYWKALINTKQLVIQARKLEKANKAKSIFLANMSHELRTPMNAILGFAQILDGEENLSKDHRNYVSEINGAGTHLLKLINEILDLSKIEEGHLKLEQIEFDLFENIDELVALLAPSAHTKKLDFEVFVDPAIPRYVVGDSHRIRQILTNLIGNAIKFTSQGRVSLTVSMNNSDEYLFEVRDEGIGIPVEVQPNLFKPFAQADESTTRHFGGTGLGLAISHQLVKAMGGSIGLESQPESGTVFWFKLTLPVVDKSERLIDNHKEISAQDIESSMNTQKRVMDSYDKTVLLVEDNVVNQRVAEKMLSTMGFTVTVVNNGSEAVEKVRSDHFDLIFMDVQMPIMDGYEATKKIREHEKNSGKQHIIIAMTANAMSGDREHCLEIGMDDYISKPINLGELQDKVAFWLPALARE